MIFKTSLSMFRKMQRFLQKVELYTIIKMQMIDVYQPLACTNSVKAQRHNGSLGRWQAIEMELGNLEGSALDIGCNFGFFTFQMARKGLFCVGIESERLSYHICNLIKEVGEFENAVFLKAVVDGQFCKKLPTVDVTIFLSVFHHIVRQFGIEAATHLVQELMGKTRRVLFFETGQSNETNTSWAKYLPEMGPNPKLWIENYFTSLGALRVRYLGDYETHLSPVKRSLFAVYVG